MAMAMAMAVGCKYTPGEEVLVGKVLRKRVRGEAVDYGAAECIREADVYADDPAHLTALFPPTNRGPDEWFFFSWCKIKKKKSKKYGGGGGVKKRWRKERTVRGAGGVEIGQWRSTQAVKNVIQMDVAIGYHQNFEFRDVKKRKSDWLMEEYGILPSSSVDGAEAADDKELVICKIYKTPAARRAEAKQSTAPTTALPPPLLQVLSPPSWSALPSLLPTSWPNLQQPQALAQPPPPESGTPSLSMLPPLDMPWHDMAPTPFCPLDRDWPDVPPHGAVVFPELYEAVAPFKFTTCSSVSEDQEEEEEDDLRAFLPSVLTERPQALSHHAHNPHEFFFGMIEDGFPFGEMPTIVDDYLMIDDSTFNFLDTGYLVM